MGIVWVPLTRRGSHYWGSLKIQLIFCSFRGWRSLFLVDILLYDYTGFAKNEAKSKNKTSLKKKRLESNNHQNPEPDHSTCGFKITLKHKIYLKGSERMDFFSGDFRKAVTFFYPLSERSTATFESGSLNHTNTTRVARKVFFIYKTPQKKRTC